MFYITERMHFPIKDKEFLKSYNKIWKKVSNIIKKEFNSKLARNKKYLKINIEGPSYICTPLVLIDSVYIKNKNIIPKCFQWRDIIIILMILMEDILMKYILMKDILQNKFIFKKEQINC